MKAPDLSVYDIRLSFHDTPCHLRSAAKTSIGRRRGSEVGEVGFMHVTSAHAIGLNVEDSTSLLAKSQVCPTYGV